MTLLYNLLLKLDEYYSKPIKELDEAIRKKMHNVFMSRWSAFSCSHSLSCFCNGQTILSEGDGRGDQEGAQRLRVSTVGLSRDGFTRKGGISSIRN